MRTGLRAARLFALALVCVIAGGWFVGLGLSAQEPADKNQAKEPTKNDDEFWFATRRQRAATAAQLVALRNPLTIYGIRLKLKDELVWGEQEFVGEFAPSLNPDWLADIVDGRSMPITAGKEEKEIKTPDLAMYRLYNEALIHAFQQPPDVFKKSARDNDFIKFPHVWNEPKIHRGKVIPLYGRLVRIRKYEAPLPAKAEGIRFVHEGWVFGETKNAHPYAIIFPVLPDGFEVTEQMNRKIMFDGYFIGKIKVRAPKGDIDVPLMIGPTIVADQRADVPPDDSTPFSLMVLIGVVALLSGLVAVICGLSWWFCKGDTAIQAKLTARKQQETLAMMENPDQWNLSGETNPQSQTGITVQPPEPPRGN